MFWERKCHQTEKVLKVLLTQNYSGFEILPSKKDSEVIKEMGDFLKKEIILIN